MSDTSPLTGEASNSKLAAVFAQARDARAAAQAVATALSLEAGQVQVIAPTEPHPGRRLEPETRGIWRTIVVAHARLGLAGAVLGLLAFALLYAAQVPFIASSPVASALVLLFFGAIGGLLLGGLVALRPGHVRYVDATRAAIAAGDTTVVVHAFSTQQRDRAAELLRHHGGEVTSTL